MATIDTQLSFLGTERVRHLQHERRMRPRRPKLCQDPFKVLKRGNTTGFKLSSAQEAEREVGIPNSHEWYQRVLIWTGGTTNMGFSL